ncbi:MAG: hypothetical protein JXA13_07340 [Anaerolineales bacterium]|nr:hypothetical protein [Anaerolineales bacterium]
MSKLREMFGYSGLKEKKYPLVGENFTFHPSRYNSLTGFESIHSTNTFSTAARAFSREYFLRSKESPQALLRIVLTLFWNGCLPALDALFNYAESFENAIPASSTENTVDTYNLGNFGLAWNWENDPQPTHITFLRSNLLVTLEGHALGDRNIQVAREIDRRLQILAVVKRYTNRKNGFLKAFRKAANFRPFSSDHRIDLGLQPSGEQFFFRSTSGSVNRDPDIPKMWFLQTGETGAHTLTLFRTDDGILPEREQVEFTVEEREACHVPAAE